jgi:uncharacterized protein YjbI with pentapeptide repeats
MANPEHLKILKQGVEVWNKWQRANPGIRLDLSEADFSGADLHGANLSKVNLRGAVLQDADLREANLSRAKLGGARLSGARLVGADLTFAYLDHADLTGVDLREADLGEADLVGAILKEARLGGANLGGTDLKVADLRKADLREADLSGAYLEDTNLEDARLIGVIFGATTIAHVNLSKVDRLEKSRHISPSNISTSTIQLSLGKIPETFLRGCGISDLDIEYANLYNPDLSNHEIDEILYKIRSLRAQQPLQTSPLFISYSQADSEFVEKVVAQFNDRGIRFWRDVHQAKAGLLKKQIDRAIRYNQTVLLVLSENSIEHDWVQHEVRFARELEQGTARHVLYPVALDDSWKSSSWSKRVMEQVMENNILDFSKWEDEDEFKKQFGKLVNGLDLFYKG